MLSLLLFFSTVPAATLEDVGVSRPKNRTLIVVTPGVDPVAYAEWADVLERRGLDVWLLHFGPDDLPGHAPHEVSAAAEALGPLRVAAHGYGGVLVLASGITPERLVLVGTPLAAHVVVPELPPAEVGIGWPEAWTGPLPPAPVHPEMQAAYRSWLLTMPDFATPTCPTLLIGANLDVVAPPETMRLPSVDWPARTWERVGPLSMETRDPLHAELLSGASVARRVARFLAEGT